MLRRSSDWPWTRICGWRSNEKSFSSRSKEGGRSNVRFFTDEMNAQAVERLAMDKDLRLALEREEFFLLYQPQMDIGSGRITGFEALIRWQHPEMGLIAPDRFIAIAENNRSEERRVGKACR